MSARLTVLFLAVLVCALWPQGLVLCVGEDGHVEFEPGGAPCCPDESQDGPDCEDCADYSSPEMARATPGHTVTMPVATRTVDAVPPPPGLDHRAVVETSPPLLWIRAKQTVVLLV